MKQAADAATEAAQLVRGANEAWQMAVGYRMDAGEWAEAIKLIGEWRTAAASAGLPPAADLATAHCQMGLAKYADAVATLKPHVAAAAGAAPAANAPTTAATTGATTRPTLVPEQVLPLYAEALFKSGQADVSEAMSPLLRRSEAGRQQYLSFTLANVSPPQAATWLKRAQDAADAAAASPGTTPQRSTPNACSSRRRGWTSPERPRTPRTARRATTCSRPCSPSPTRRPSRST